MADKTFTQIQSDHPSIDFPDEAIFGYDNPLTGVTEGIDGASLRLSAVNNAAVAATTVISTLSSNYTTLASQVAAFSTQSTLIMRRGPATAISAATTVIQDLTAANAAFPFVADSGIVGFFRYKLTNTNTAGGTPVAIAFLLKLAGLNSLQPPNITLNGAGASTAYWIDVFLLLNAGSTNLINNKTMIVQVRPFVTANSNTSFAFGNAVDAATANVLDMSQTVESTGFDIGTTQPSVEMRANMTTAVANTTLTKIVAELYLVQDH